MLSCEYFDYSFLHTRKRRNLFKTIRYIIYIFNNVFTLPAFPLLCFCNLTIINKLNFSFEKENGESTLLYI